MKSEQIKEVMTTADVTTWTFHSLYKYLKILLRETIILMAVLYYGGTWTSLWGSECKVLNSTFGPQLQEIEQHTEKTA